MTDVPVRLRGVVPVGEESRLLQYFYMCGVWALTTYSGCDIRCSYCVSYAQGASHPRVPPGKVAQQLKGELEALPPDAAVCVGSLIDGYPNAEERWGVTREALEVLVESPHQIIVVTKGTTLRRDIDLLRDRADLSVDVSLPTLDEDALRRIEPQAPTAAERLALIHDLAAAGVAVQLHVQPVIPEITDPEAMIDAAGDRVAVCFGPLNIQSPAIRARGLTSMDQLEINRHYVAARCRVGFRQNVRWQRPIWLGTELLDRFDHPRRPLERCEQPGATATDESIATWMEPPPHLTGSTTVSDRNRATVLRYVDAYRHDAAHLVILEIMSPFVRGHEPPGLASRPGSERSGQFRDLLAEVRTAVEGHRVTVEHLTADDDLVEVVVRVSGRQTGPLFGRAAGGDIEVLVENRYRFDGNGLIVEYWQRSCKAVEQLVDAR